jgi:dTDP-glucose pyrophosphorylase
MDDVSGYGIIEPHGEEVIRVVEKPQGKEAPSQLAIVGCYAFSSKIFLAARATQPNKRTGEVELTDAIQNLIVAGEKVCFLKFEGKYLDTGKLEETLGSFESFQ